MFPPERLRLIGAIMPVLKDSPWWDKRYEVEWYVNRCEMAGFCNTDDMRKQCALRYMAGKRKVTPPGTERRKRSERELRRILAAVPADLSLAISREVEAVPESKRLRADEKLVNYITGRVLRAVASNPSAVKTLVRRLLDGKEGA